MHPIGFIRRILSLKILSSKQSRFVIVLSLTFLLFYIECFFIIFDILGQHTMLYNFFIVCAGFLFLNVLYNLLFIIITDPSIAKLMIAQRCGPDWSYCIRCESVRPPRAHHCRQCDVCVIRFDHHCTFLAQCIGLANMKYFMHLLIQISICCFIATGFNFLYVFRFIYSDWYIWQTLLCILNPAPFVFIGWLSWRQFFLCLMTSLCTIFGPATAIFFIYHLRRILRNQTCVEVLIASAKNPSQISYDNADLRPLNFDLGWRSNLEQVMGKRWLVGFFLPFISSQQTIDGLSYPLAEN
ncbi:unnamed protein product [Hymenolepis diminuta]|uniref:Palmitoyltransferase n=1 Tax=Hymenolepis diminuta TaxID=6216 RepID=A0A564YCC9_HYMDI|nr:unnamed protein product [Hymenolepis diminuta]